MGIINQLITGGIPPCSCQTNDGDVLKNYKRLSQCCLFQPISTLSRFPRSPFWSILPWRQWKHWLWMRTMTVLGPCNPAQTQSDKRMGDHSDSDHNFSDPIFSVRRRRLWVSMTSPKLACGFARQTEDNNCPSGKTNQRLWSGILNSRAMRLWMFQPGSLRWTCIQAHHFVPSQTAASQQHSISLQAQSSCNTRSSTEWQICNVPSPWKGGLRALSATALSTNYNMAVTSEKHCVILACRHLDKFDSFFRQWNVALSTIIHSKSFSIVITCEKHCAANTCRKPACMPLCCIPLCLPKPAFRKTQHCRLFLEVLCGPGLQTSG